METICKDINCDISKLYGTEAAMVQKCLILISKKKPQKCIYVMTMLMPTTTAAEHTHTQTRKETVLIIGIAGRCKGMDTR